MTALRLVSRSTLVVLTAFALAAGCTGDPSPPQIEKAAPQQTGPALIESRSIAVGSGVTRFVLVDSQPGELHFVAEVGALEASDFRTSEGPYTRLAIPGFSATHHEGQPELPMMNRLIAVPHGATANIEVIAQTSERVSLAAVGVAFPVMPAQPSQPKCGSSDGTFVCDHDSYAASVVSEPLLTVVPQGRLRNIEVARLELAPVQYFPATQEIEVVTSIDFKVTFTSLHSSVSGGFNPYAESPYFEAAYDRIAGTPGFVRAGHGNLVRDVVTYVIIAPRDYVATLESFVAWKTAKGFHVITGVVGTGAGTIGTTKEQIKAYIRDLYVNATADVPAPSFVTLVGDIAQVPTFVVDGETTDRPYCTIDDDLIPDIYYGRLPAATKDQLVAILDKTLVYDELSMPDPSYLGRSVLIAGVDSSHAPTWGNGQINYGSRYFFNAAHGNTPWIYLYPDSGGSGAAAKIVANVSSGAGYVNYTAHGSEGSWADPSFTQDNVRKLTNVNKYPIVVGNCCLTSSYQVDEAFSETWLRVAKKGAVGYIGGSNSSYWDEDYWWGVGSGPISADPTLEGTGYGAYDAVFHDHGEPLGNWFVTSYGLLMVGNLAVTEAAGPRVAYYWNIYNLAGDPSLYVHTRAPTDNPVTLPAKVFTNATSLHVSADVGSYIGVTQSGVLIGAATVKGEGAADVALWTKPAAGPLHIVVSAQNRKVFLADMTVVEPAVVKLAPAAIAVNALASVQVGVYEADGVTPISSVEVWAEGYGYRGPAGFTNAAGQVTLAVNYAYGPSVKVMCRRATDAEVSFSVPLAVDAPALPAAELHVTTTFGLVDSFALNLAGKLVGSTSLGSPSGLVVYAAQATGTTSAVGAALDVTPSAGRALLGVLAVPGYAVFEKSFPVIVAYGTLGGTLDVGGAPRIGATVRLLDGAGAKLFEETTDASGRYAFKTEVPVGSYVLSADSFGCLHFESTLFVGYGQNVSDVHLATSTAGVLRGTVTDSKTGAALAAKVRAYRADTLELVAETTAAASGAYTLPGLVYYSYVVEAKIAKHIAARQPVTIGTADAALNFALEPTRGDLLVIDDAGGAATQLVSSLQQAGYGVAVETLAATNPATWTTYDLVAVACESNALPLADLTKRTALVSFVKGGGKLLIDGGELAYKVESDLVFRNQVLHVSQWKADNGGNVVAKQPLHAIMKTPNALAATLAFTYGTWADQDVVIAASDAKAVASFSNEATSAAIIAYAPPAGSLGGRSVFLPFSLKSLDALVVPKLVQNVATWLLASRAEQLLGKLLINEVLADPPAGIDVNHDGVASAVGDEFVEIVNISDETLDLSGLYVMDETARLARSLRYEFPAGALLAAGQATVVWGAMAPLVLESAGDTVYLALGEESLDSVHYGSEGGYGVSLTRAVDGDPTSPFVQHSSLPAKMSYSPGLRGDGSAF